jgi:hypothetical protein
MDLAKFLASLLLFVFGVALTPQLTTTLETSSLSGNLGPLIHVFPMIFILLLAIGPIYFAIKEKD